MLKQFFVNPGFSHIGESICMKLDWSDHKSLVSLKEEYNSDFLNKSSFWLKKCEYPEILNQSVDQSWKDLSKEIKINTNSKIGTTNNDLESTFVAMLIKIHENPYKYDKSSPLHLACELGDIKMVKFILKTWDITCHQSKLDFPKDRCDHTPILIAAAAGYEKIVKLLIPFYENPRVKAITGWSALTLAAMNGHLKKHTQTFKCGHCGKTHTNASDFHQHTAMSHGNKIPDLVKDPEAAANLQALKALVEANLVIKFNTEKNIG